MLGKIDDADETFVNGVRVGGQGAFPPAARSARGAYRRYPVEPGALNWGGENVVAVRVFDGGGGRGGDGGSGEWDARRDRPAGIWVSEGAPRWWTVALINWDAEPRDLSATLADLGIPAGRLHAYDVWRDAPMDDVRGQLTTRLEPHGVLVAGLRPARDRPQIIGTTRHVVQGALDVADEAWDAATHTLRGRAVALDDRAYAVTIAAPGGRRPETCTATRACTLRPATGGHVVLEWPGDAGGRDIEWALRFRADAAP